MTVLIVEDNQEMQRELMDGLQRRFPEVQFQTCATEHAFYALLPALAATPPALIIMDMLLPWTDPAPIMPPQPPEVAREGFFRAGWRCQAALTADSRTAQVPVIIHSDLSENDLGTEQVRTRPPNVFVIPKTEPARLRLVIENVLTMQQGGTASRPEVFLVHGHDDATREEVAKYLTELQLLPRVLRDEAHGGLRTMLEKFENHADVAFAVVLLTADDVGEARDRRRRLRPRARQNVVLELGFFMGRLGREKVVVLSKADVEIPSDLEGLAKIFIHDDGRWRGELLREFHRAGLALRTALPHP